MLINESVLLDCGDESFLKQLPKAILITHLHPDHAFFVRRDHYTVIEIPIFVPEAYKDEPITLTDKPFSIDNYHITPIPTVHSLKVKSNAYLITYHGRKFFYTGDMIWIEKQYHYLLDNLDFVITESSWMRKGGMIRCDQDSHQIFGHTGVPDLIKLFKQFTSTIIFVDFGTWFFKDIKKARAQYEQLAKENDREIIVGYDGLELEL